MSIRMEACFPTMYTWAQTHTYRCDPGGPKGRQIQSHQISPLTLDVSIFKQLPWTDAWMAHTHAHTHPHTAGSVLQELWHSRGTRRVPSWKPVAMVTIMELISHGPASFTQLPSQKNTHKQSAIAPHSSTNTHTVFSSFCPLWWSPEGERVFDLNQVQQKAREQSN